MKKLSILLTLLFFTTAIFAQPANDDCADAIVVTSGEVVDFTNIDATIDGPFHPNCVSNINDTIFADIWYSFTPDFTGFADWSMCSTADFDTKIAVYNGNFGCDASDADLLVCNDDFGSCGGSTSRAVFEVTAGETYLLRLGGWGETAPGMQGSGTFTIGEFITTVDNDFCMFAEEVFLGEDQEFLTTGATTDGPDHPGNDVCFGFGSLTVGQDIWYTFTAPATGAVEWSTCDQINFDSRMAVYNPGSPCPPADGDLYACNDDGSGCMNFSSRLIFDVVEGETYLLRLGGYAGESGTGFFDLLEVIPPEPPANDLCDNAAGAELVSVDQANDFEGQIDGTTVNATFDPDNFPEVNAQCANFNPGGEFNTVWYTFNNLGNEEVEVIFFKEADFLDAAFYIELFLDCVTPIDTALYQGACLNVTSDEDFGTTVMSGLSPDPTDYWLRVYTRATTDLPGDFFFFLVADITQLDAKEAFPGTFEVFPNPTSDELNLSLFLDESVDATFQVFNTLGQTISTRSVGLLGTGQHSFQFDTEYLNSGMYFLSVQSDKGTSLVKFLKE